MAHSTLPYPTPSDGRVSKRMKRNVRADTRPEVVVRSALHKRGWRFRKHLPVQTAVRVVRPDIVFTKDRLAVFIDGCFWHCCPIHENQPRINTAYWRPKLERNVARDRLVDNALEEAGWTVLRAWEHENPNDVADRVEEALGQPTR